MSLSKIFFQIFDTSRDNNVIHLRNDYVIHLRENNVIQLRNDYEFSYVMIT